MSGQPYTGPRDVGARLSELEGRLEEVIAGLRALHDVSHEERDAALRSLSTELYRIAYGVVHVTHHLDPYADPALRPGLHKPEEAANVR